MLDPVPPPPSFLFDATKPLADFISAQTLPYHIHEVLLATFFYQATQSIISPVLSSYLFPRIYPQLNRRTRLNWDVHVVSLVQSCLINTLALYVMFTDQERKTMNTIERVYGYTGGCGMIQGMAAGYFVWDLVICTRYFKFFGIGLWAHAVCALAVFSLGFRPFANYYGPTFILYELSSPFLNIHWFCDKLNMTGSKLQWYNGMILLATFFSCRLVWGTYQSFSVFKDIFAAMSLGSGASGALDIASNMTTSTTSATIFVPRDGQLCLGDLSCIAGQAQVMKFAGPGTKPVPMWLTGIYLVSNLLLNSLNFYWFSTMIDAVLKRFREIPAKGEVSAKKPRRQSLVLEVADEFEQADRMHGSMVLEHKDDKDDEAVDTAESVAVSTAVDTGTEVKKR